MRNIRTRVTGQGQESSQTVSGENISHQPHFMQPPFFYVDTSFCSYPAIARFTRNRLSLVFDPGRGIGVHAAGEQSPGRRESRRGPDVATPMALC